MKKWIIYLVVIAIFVFLTALFLTPSFTVHCTDELLVCVENGKNASFGGRLWAHLGCVYHNVICVLGGLFV
ncbi:MAG: hypothetical protein II938_04135 [Alphaproteobacteria bacterium]|nr:hypothetical protein [Alphaproteobacteria bacterium]